MRVLLSCLLLLTFVPDWAGDAPLQPLGRRASMTIHAVPLEADDPQRHQAGALTFLGGVALGSSDSAFGGFSALSVVGDRFTLLSDSGAIVTFRMAADWEPHALRFGNLPGGPGTGWFKWDRDSESMAIAPSGSIYVGMENSNAIWRYAPGFARVEGHSKPPAMRDWQINLGAESLAYMPGGGFVVINEGEAQGGGKGHAAVRFTADPVRRPTTGFRFTYLPPAGFAPSDATALPNGDLLVLNRRFELPFRLTAKVTLVRGGDIRPGALVGGREIATFAPPLIHDNFEGITTMQEGADTIVWIVSDDNQMWLQRSLLLKFRLNGAP